MHTYVADGYMIPQRNHIRNIHRHTHEYCNCSMGMIKAIYEDCVVCENFRQRQLHFIFTLSHYSPRACRSALCSN